MIEVYENGAVVFTLVLTDYYSLGYLGAGLPPPTPTPTPTPTDEV
jgi:hypothetical protein